MESQWKGKVAFNCKSGGIKRKNETRRERKTNNKRKRKMKQMLKSELTTRFLEPWDNGKRVAEGKSRGEKTAAHDLDNEKKGDEMKKKKGQKKWKNKKKGDEMKKKKKKKKWKNKKKGDEMKKKKKKKKKKWKNKKKGDEMKKKKKWKNKKKDEMEDKARAANEGEEELIGDHVHAPKPANAKEENVGARREPRPRLIRRTHWRKTGIGRKFQAVERNKGEEELIGDEVHAPKLASVEPRREWKPRLNPPTPWRKAKVGRMFQATERSKGEEELVGDEVHAPELASVKEGDVEAARESESQQTFNPRTHACTAEIGRKFEAMSVNSEMRIGDNRRYGRQTFNFKQRGGGNWEVSRSREMNRRSEWIVWVKKRKVEDQIGILIW